jgi:hypothetical protein
MPPENPAIDALCTPMVVFQNQAPTTVGGMRFTQHVPDPVATMQRLSREVCALLYRKPEEVRKNATIRLFIDPTYNGVAYASGGSIHFSPDHIARQGNNAERLSAEIHGVLAHEVTHLWQQNQGGTRDNREAVADWVRYRTGFDSLDRRRVGGNWSSAYTPGGFFISWLEDKFDRDFGYKLNVGFSKANFSYPNLVMEVTGKNIDAVWADYQAELRAMRGQDLEAMETDYETLLRIESGHQDLVDQAIDLGWRRAIKDLRF